MSKLHEWEEIAPNTYCMEVPNGWLYRYMYYFNDESADNDSLSVAMVFVPTNLSRARIIKTGGR